MPKIPLSKNGHVTKNFVRVFEAFGYAFSVNGSTEAIAEACPFCEKDRFYLNIETGLYHCKKCQAKGNVVDFLNWVHQQYLEKTTVADYHWLKEKRGGIALQTLKRHELAYDRDGQRYLIPFKNAQGKVVNIQTYSTVNGTKFNLPGLGTSIYGLDRLSTDKKKILFLCEGPFDAIALDYHLGLKRGKYDILATPGTFQEKWAEYFRGRKVRALYDNDKGGEEHRKRVQKLLGESRVADEVRLLKWPAKFDDGKPIPDGYDINDLVSQHPEISVVGFSLEHSIKVTAEPKLILRHGKDRTTTKRQPIEWIWLNHIRTGTYISFSGQQGTFKSTIAGDIVARYTRGKPMPFSNAASMSAGYVLYIHAEDDEDAMWERFEVAGADCERITLMPATLIDGDPMNILNHLGEIEETIKEYDIQLVIIDGQNSVVGTPDISTDMKGRFNVTNRLHQFAQRMNIALIGIRNEDATGRAMGSQSMGDISRCVLRTVENEPGSNPPYCKLVFVKVSDTARSNYPAIPYSVQDLGGNHRKILWGKTKPKISEQEIKATLLKSHKGVK